MALHRNSAYGPRRGKQLFSNMRNMHRFRFIPRMDSLIRIGSPLIYYIVSNDSESRREGPDSTVRIRRLVWAFVFCICPKTHFRMVRPIQMKFKKKSDPDIQISTPESLVGFLSSCAAIPISMHFKEDLRKYSTIRIYKRCL